MASVKRINKDKFTGKIKSWTLRAYKCTQIDGKQKEYTKTFKVDPSWSNSRIEKEIEKSIILYEQEIKRGFTLDNKQTFEQYANYVIELKERNGIKHSTIQRYKELLKRINQGIGHLKIKDIKPQHLNQLYEQLQQKGLNKTDGGYLSNKTIIEHHRLIHAILAQAEKELLVDYNMASKASPPKNQTKEADCLEIEDVNTILYFAKQEPLKYQVLLNLLVYTGCRRGEIVGLKWCNVDFKNNRIKIENNLLYTKERGVYNETPKTETSKRLIDLPSDVMELLKIYKKDCTCKKLNYGTKWINSGYVLIDEFGNYMHPDTPTGYLRKFVKKYNKIIKENIDNHSKIKPMPHLHPHLFRHSNGSILLKSGVDIATISKHLGHAKISTTLDIYSHQLEKDKPIVADTLSNILLKRA